MKSIYTIKRGAFIQKYCVRMNYFPKKHLATDWETYFETKTSTMADTAFMDAHSDGCFATRDLDAGTTIAPNNDLKHITDANDAMWDMRGVITATTHVEMYTALHLAVSMYYTKTRARDLVNVVLACNGALLEYKTVKPVKKGDELLRCYGLPTWVMELAQMGILTTYTIVGYFKWIEDLVASHELDTHYSDIVYAILHTRTSMLDHIYPDEPFGDKTLPCDADTVCRAKDILRETIAFTLNDQGQLEGRITTINKI